LWFLRPSAFPARASACEGKAVALQSLRVTPAMEAGVSDHVWSLEEIVGLVD
jgi:hypothetical protein